MAVTQFLVSSNGLHGFWFYTFDDPVIFFFFEHRRGQRIPSLSTFSKDGILSGWNQMLDFSHGLVRLKNNEVKKKKLKWRFHINEVLFCGKKYSILSLGAGW